MNKKARFGYDMLGMHITVKLNVCLSESNLHSLECDYKEWVCFYPGYKGRTRIEGVLPIGSQEKFQNDLKLAMIRSKIDALKAQESAVLSYVMRIDKPIPNFNTFL